MKHSILAIAILAAQSANAVSLDGTTLTANETGPLVTADGNWTLSTDTGPSGYKVLLNGSNNNGGQAILLEVLGGKLYAMAQDKSWWLWSNGWNSTTAPVITGQFPVTLTWTPPTTNNDNTPYTDPKGYNVYWASAPGKYTDVNKFTLNMANISSTQLMFPAGTFYFSMSAVNSKDVPSLLSNETSTTNPKPGTFTIDASVQLKTSMTTVYSDQKQTDVKAMRAVGTIPLGEICSSKEALMVDGAVFYGVPRSKVTWAGSSKPGIVYGLCQ